MCNICRVAVKCDGQNEGNLPTTEELEQEQNLTEQNMDYYTTKEIAMGIAHLFEAIQIIVDCLHEQGSTHI